MKLRFMAALLALTLCGGLFACGETEIPDSIVDLAIDDSVECDYSSFLGEWTSDDGSILTVEEYERMRFDLSTSEGELVTAGDFQYVEKYGYVYAVDQRDGSGHRCWFDENGRLYIDSLGSFGKTGDGGVNTDYSFLAGTWYLDGEADGYSSIEIDEHGNWTLYERPDGDPTEVDQGTISKNPEDESMYFANSTKFSDAVYDMYVVDNNTMYWGGENDYYAKQS